MRVGLTYDLREDYLRRGYSEEETAEFDAPETVDALVTALEGLEHDVVRIGGLHDLVPRLAVGERWDLVFNIAEGLLGFGREAQVPALLEGYDMPYVFSDPLVLALCLHKGMAKRVVRDAGVPTPDFAVVERLDDVADVRLPFPVFVKPVAEGTSKGIGLDSRAEDRAGLRRTCRQLLTGFRQPILVETYLPGREFTVGILGSGKTAVALGVMEVSLRAGAEQGVYSFHNKEHYENNVDYALRDGDEAQTVAEVALAAWRALGCRDGGRVDVRLDAAGRPHFLEANPLAGLHPVRSDLVILARQVGLDHRGLIARIVQAALLRLGRRPRSEPAGHVTVPAAGA